MPPNNRSRNPAALPPGRPVPVHRAEPAAALVLAVLLLLPLPAAAEPSARLEPAAPPTRAYTMGEVVDEVFFVTVPKDYTLETGFLPAPGAVNEWLEIRGVDWSRDQGAAGSRYRIRVAYQVFAGVRAPEKATLPPLPVRFHGPEPLEVTAPEWAFTVRPLIAPNTADEAVEIRADALPRPRGLAGHWRRFWLCLSLALALAGGLAWLRLDASLRASPFGRAHRQLARLRRGAGTPEALRSAARLIHRALNETAGRTLFAGEVAPFCGSQPGFAELKDDLAGFFALSRRLFFTAPEAPPPADGSIERLAELCRRCAAAERPES